MQTLADFLRSAPFELVLSSGFFGFYAHAGVVAALEEQGLWPAAAGGSSAGAMIAGLWAAGLSAAQIREELFALNRVDFWDPDPLLGLRYYTRKLGARSAASAPPQGSEGLDTGVGLLRGEASRSASPTASASTPTKPGGGIDHKERRTLANKLKRLEEQVEKLTLAERKAEQALVDAATHQGSNAMELVRLEQARADAVAAREQAEVEWMDLAERLEAG